MKLALCIIPTGLLIGACIGHPSYASVMCAFFIGCAFGVCSWLIIDTKETR